MFKKITICIFSFIFLIEGQNILVAQGFEWVDVPHTGNIEAANSIAVDSINHFVYMGGGLTYAPLGNYGINSWDIYGGKDGLVAKYDFDGNVVWAFNIGGNNDDEVTGITLDPSGNIYITGYYTGNIDLTGASFSGVSGSVLTSFGGTDIFIASYTSDGALRFYQVMGSSGNDMGIDICANNSGIYVDGVFANSMLINGNNSSISYNNVNIFVAALDFTGNFLWSNDMGSDADDYDGASYQDKNMGIAADDNSVYVIGMMGGDNFGIYKDDGTLQDTLFNDDATQNIFILSIESATGILNWAQDIENNTDPVSGMDIAVNNEGVYITGMCHNNAVFPNGIIVSAPSNSFAFLSKLDKVTGFEGWTKTFYGSSTNNDVGYAVTADNSHGVYVTGKYVSNPFYFDTDTLFNGANQEEVFFTGYSDDGTFLWAINAEGPNNESGLDITSFDKNTIFTAGVYSEDIYFAPYHGTSTNDMNNLFVGKLHAKSGFQFDNSGCTGDLDSNGVITEVNGSSNLTVEPCQHVQICETIYVMDNMGNGWLDSLTFVLGQGLTNITNLSPNGTNNGFYQQGNWEGTYNSSDNTIIWAFNNTTTHPDYGDGYEYNNPYSCAQGTPHEYHFCFEADISSTTISNNDLDINITIADDGYSTYTSILHASVLMNEIILNDPPPVFDNCPNDTLIYTNGNTCSATYSWVQPIASDNCNATITQISGLPSGSDFPLGNSLITYVASDTAGNTDTCTFHITVEDNEPPVITCISNQIRYNASGSCSYTAMSGEFNPTVSDNCTITLVTNNINGSNSLAGEIFPMGTTNIVWTAIDGAGNIDSCSFDVTILDTVPPEINCLSNQTVNVNAGTCTYTVTGTELNPTSFSDDCSTVALTNSINATSSLVGESFLIGNTTVTWFVADSSGNTASCSFNVNVIDDTPPVINCASDQTVSVAAASCNYTVTGNMFSPASVNDNCGTVIVTNNLNGTSSLNGEVLPIGQNTIWWTATDNAGNSDSCFVTVTVVDSILPQISCPGNQVRQLNNNCEYIVQGNELNPVSASDNCNYFVHNNINNADTLNGENFGVGTYPIAWYIEDNTGNIDSCSFTLTVVDTILPSIICQGNTNLYADSLSCSYFIQGQELDPVSVSDNCSTFTLTNNFNGLNSLQGENLPVGQHPVTWTVIDQAGNTANCTDTIAILDTIAPLFE
ncbi:MAG: hypothetical protein DRP35_08760, partial [Candidatus Zixiibacteriota bacterium]